MKISTPSFMDNNKPFNQETDPGVNTRAGNAISIRQISVPKFLPLLILILLSGCNFPTELPGNAGLKPADKFARAFIDNIIGGELKTAFSEMPPLTDNAKKMKESASHLVRGAIVKNYRVAENCRTTFYSGKKAGGTYYTLRYEYEFEELITGKLSDIYDASTNQIKNST